MVEADAIVLGSPVYYGNVNAQTKAIMDRTFSIYRDRKLRGKVASPVLAVRRLGAGEARSFMYSFFISHGMIPVRGAIGYGMNKGDVLQGDGGALGVSALEEAQNTGKEIVSVVRKLAK
jgi:multimeric flavodoxin WrbA